MPANIAASLPATPQAIPNTAVAGNPIFWASVAGQRIVSGALSMPLYGAWMADVVLATDTPLPPLLVVTLGNLTLQGAVYRQTTFAGRTEARLVAGAGGWNKTVEQRGYDNPAGVLASQVLNDAAIEVGEKVTILPDRVLGTLYVRYADKASRVLRATAANGGEQWWIDPAGLTHVSQRLGIAIASDFQIESFSGASGRATIATEDPASWMPGNTFASATIAPQTIASVRHVFGNDGVARLEVMTSGNNDRWIEDVRQIIRDELAASVAFSRIWDYEVVLADAISGEVQAVPVDAAAIVPPLTGLQLSQSISAIPGVGQHIAVGFLDANPGKPIIFGTLGAFNSFVEAFVNWHPTGVVGDGPALKALLVTWGLSVNYTPPILP